MANIEITSLKFKGTALPQTVAVHANRRRYMAFIAQDGMVHLSFGNSDHDKTSFSIAAGNMMETDVNNIAQVKYNGEDSYLIVLQDLDSKLVIFYDNLALTYNSETLFFHNV